MNPGDLYLPAILDPILAYLADTLPPPLYNFVLNFLSHCLVLLSGFLNLLASLLSRSPSEWDAQTLLPPLISLLAAYFALWSIYRTTAWMIRTTFFFLKWGIILGLLVASVGWYIGVTQADGVDPSPLSHLGQIALKVLNGFSHGGGPILQSYTKSNKRPKPWESFDRHRQWQYSEDQTETDQGSGLGSLFDNVMNMVLREDSQWWSAMRGMSERAASGEGQAAEGNRRGNAGTSR